MVNNTPISNEIGLRSGVLFMLYFTLLTYIHSHTHIYTHVHININTHIYIYIYMCDMKNKANKVVMKMPPNLACRFCVSN